MTKRQAELCEAWLMVYGEYLVYAGVPARPLTSEERKTAKAMLAEAHIAERAMVQAGGSVEMALELARVALQEQADARATA